jgi:hypothetical protein
MFLTAQVNRFTGAGAPATYRMLPDPLPLAAGKPLDMSVAIVAVGIYQRRAQDAFMKNGGQAERDMIDRANAAFGDPVGFVNANMAEVTDSIEHFADSLSLPKAQGVGGGGFHLSIPLVVGLGLLAALLFGRR